MISNPKILNPGANLITVKNLNVNYKFMLSQSVNKSGLFNNKNAAIHLHEFSQMWFSFYTLFQKINSANLIQKRFYFRSSTI